MNWLYTWLGLSNGGGAIYLFWSGFFGDITIFGGIIVLYWKHNCHCKGCFRIAKHHIDGTPYCIKHKKDVNELRPTITNK